MIALAVVLGIHNKKSIFENVDESALDVSIISKYFGALGEV